MAKTETIKLNHREPLLAAAVGRWHGAHGRVDRRYGIFVVYPLVLILVNSFNTATIAEPPVYGLKSWATRSANMASGARCGTASRSASFCK